MVLGVKIRELREKRNISQKELGEAIGVSDVMISMYEQGKKKPSVKTMAKLAEYFGVTTDHLLGAGNSIDELEMEIPEGVTILRRLKTMSPSAQKRMINIMTALIEEEEKGTDR